MSCPICYENIDENKNRVITECGHCFHTSCLMTHAAINGFGCPYCREKMSTHDDLTEAEEMISYTPSEDQTPYVLRLEDMTEEELDIATNRNQIESEQDDTGLMFPESYVMPTPTFMTRKLQERGITVEDLVRLIMNEVTGKRDERIDGPIERTVYGAIQVVIHEYNH